MAQFWSEPLTRETLPEFFNEFAEAAYSYIYSITGDEAATERMVEDAFVRVYRQRKHLQPNQLILVLGAELDKASGALSGAEPSFEAITPDVACMARMLNHVLHKADSIMGGWGAAIGGAAAGAGMAAAATKTADGAESEEAETSAEALEDGQEEEPLQEVPAEPEEQPAQQVGFEDEVFDGEDGGLPPDPPDNGIKRKRVGILLLVLLVLLGGTAVTAALWGRTPASNPQVLTSPPELVTSTPTPAGVILTPTPTVTATPTPTVTPTPTPTPSPEHPEPSELPSAAQAAYKQALKEGMALAYDESDGTYVLAGTAFFWDAETKSSPSGPAQLFAGSGDTKFPVTYDPAKGVVYSASGSQRQYYDINGNPLSVDEAKLPDIGEWYMLSAVNGTEYTYIHAHTGKQIVYSTENRTFTEKESGAPYTMKDTDPYRPDDEGTGACQPRYDAEGNLYWHNTVDGVDFKAKGDGTWQTLDGSDYILKVQ